MFIGVWAAYAQIYLFLLAAIMLVGFGFPMLVSPLRWAGVFRWKAVTESHLAMYFGRCLGCLVCGLAGASFYVAFQPPQQKAWLGFLAVIFAVLACIHVYGTVKRIQPWTATLQILFLAGLAALTLAVLPLHAG